MMVRRRAGRATGRTPCRGRILRALAVSLAPVAVILLTMLPGCSAITHQIYLRAESDSTEWTRRAESLYDDYPTIRFDRPGLNVIFDEKQIILHGPDGAQLQYISIGPPIVPLFWFLGDTDDPYKNRSFEVRIEVRGSGKAVMFDLREMYVESTTFGRCSVVSGEWWGDDGHRTDLPISVRTEVCDRDQEITLFFDVSNSDLVEAEEGVVLSFPAFQVGDKRYVPPPIRFKFESHTTYYMLTMLTN